MKRKYILFYFILFMVLNGLLLIHYNSKLTDQTSSLASVNLKQAECITTPLLDPLTPEKIQNYIFQNNIQTVEDFICCLPSGYLKNYVIQHSSFALQSGVPISPRILLVNFKDENSRKPKLADVILTFTGDNQWLSGETGVLTRNVGWDHVEMMFNNPKTDKLEMHDISFEKNIPQLTQPQKCLGCHSPNLKEFQTAGAKPIFEPSPWPSSVGMDGFVIPPEHKNDTLRYLDQLSETALQAIRTQPRYACLSSTSTFFALGLDLELSKLNKRRVAKIIRSTTEYVKYRPIIVGILQGCLSQLNEFGSLENASSVLQLQTIVSKLQKWIPKNILEKQFINDKFILNPKIRDTHFLKQEAEAYLNELNRRSIEIKEHRSQIKDITTVQAYFDPESFTQNLSHSELDFLPENLDGFSNIEKLFLRYFVDTKLRLRSLGDINYILRFMFEARGISTINWDMTMAGGYTHTLSIELSDLYENEKQDDFWKNHFDLIEQSRSNKESFEKTCDNLSSESMRGF